MPNVMNSSKFQMQNHFAKIQDQPLAFSQLVLVYVFVGKPLVDLLFFWEPSKYLYMALLFMAALFAYVGNSMAIAKNDVTVNGYTGPFYYLLFGIYTLHLVCLYLYLNGDKTEILKIISPFITVAIVALCLKVDVRRYLLLVMAGIIVLNFVSLPFDFSWIMWGNIKTFKGFYFFKMDLAFTILNALVVYYFCTEKKLDLRFAILSLMVVVMIVLSNSRMNYLLLALFFGYVALCYGLSWQSLFKITGLLVVVALLVAVLYDPDKYLSPFDMSNMDSFTQGRNEIWDLIISKGLGEASIMQWLFGQGLLGDVILSETYASNTAHNAHNELLHILMTQGLFGLGTYILLWVMAVRYLLSGGRGLDRDDIVLISIIFSFFLLQSLTVVVIAFYLKTWWLVCALACCRGKKLLTINDGYKRIIPD